MKKFVLALLIVVCCASLLLNLKMASTTAQYSHLVAVSWGDSKYAPALYGAYVFTEPKDKARVVRATVYIDRPSFWISEQHQTIDLGIVQDDAEAVARWGKILWSDEGVQFGYDKQTVLIKRADLESHR
ncbi:hypothetical protein [Undibacterium sp. Xuan67W]|uniref:hypothetical protein n=1 Tax=Undibacterium sp. Xuan67W TaxID=3413057 RepID=UPI003BF04BA0